MWAFIVHDFLHSTFVNDISFMDSRLIIVLYRCFESLICSGVFLLQRFVISSSLLIKSRFESLTSIWCISFDIVYCYSVLESIMHDIEQRMSSIVSIIYEHVGRDGRLGEHLWVWIYIVVVGGASERQVSLPELPLQLWLYLSINNAIGFLVTADLSPDIE